MRNLPAIVPDVAAVARIKSEITSATARAW